MYLSMTYVHGASKIGLKINEQSWKYSQFSGYRDKSPYKLLQF